MITVIAHGYLRDLLPDPIRMSATTVREIIEGLCFQTKALHAKPGQDKHCIRVAGFNTVESIVSPIPDDVTEIHLVPELSGGKNGGFVKIALGAVLIAASFAMTGPVTLGSIGALKLGTLSATTVFWMGVTVVLGGLLELISPAPKMDTKTSRDPEASKYLGTPQNTTRAGTRIPLLYGRHMGYGHYLSFDIDAKDVGEPNPYAKPPSLIVSGLNQRLYVLPWTPSPIPLGEMVVQPLEDVETVTATLTLRGPHLGNLTTGIYEGVSSTYEPNSGTWSITGSYEVVNAALADVGFVPAIDWNHAGVAIDAAVSGEGASPAKGVITLEYNHAGQGE